MQAIDKLCPISGGNGTLKDFKSNLALKIERIIICYTYLLISIGKLRILNTVHHPICGFFISQKSVHKSGDALYLELIFQSKFEVPSILSTDPCPQAKNNAFQMI